MRQLTAGERSICENISYQRSADYVMDKFHEVWGDGWVIVDFRVPRKGEWAIGASSNLPPYHWDHTVRATNPRFIVQKRHALGRWCPLRRKP